MKTHVEFRSSQFPAYEGEEEQVNPGLYGKRLAEFLAAGLPAQGFEPEDLICEDWGWMLPVRNVGFPMWIGCGKYGDEDDRFLCFIEPHEPSIRRFFKTIDTSERVEALQKAIDAVLSESPDIREKQWWTYEEFMGSEGAPPA